MEEYISEGGLDSTPLNTCSKMGFGWWHSSLESNLMNK